MFSKLITKMERQADDALDEQLGQHKNTIYLALGALARLSPLILDETLPEHGLRAKLFAQVGVTIATVQNPTLRSAGPEAIRQCPT